MVLNGLRLFVRLWKQLNATFSTSWGEKGTISFHSSQISITRLLGILDFADMFIKKFYNRDFQFSEVLRFLKSTKWYG